MSYKTLAAIVVVILASTLAALPAAAQAKTEKIKVKPIALKSSKENSLCVNPTEAPFREPERSGKPNFEPLEASNSRGKLGTSTEPWFPDEGASCAEKVEEGKQLAPTHPTAANNIEGKGGFSDYYGSSVVQVFQQGIPGGIWVAPFAPEAKSPNNEPYYDPNPSRQNPWPAYYIYDTSFELGCVTEKTKIEGEFYADNAAGVFLNGEWIGKDHMEVTPENYGYFFSHGVPYPATKFSDSKYFKPGRNVLQFIVFNAVGDWTALDFGAKVTPGSCSNVPRWVGLTSKKVQTISWGKLTFRGSSTVRETECQAEGLTGSALAECEEAARERCEEEVKAGIYKSLEECLKAHEVVKEESTSVTCKKSDAGNVWNPEIGPGLDETVLFDLYECHGEAENCAKVEVTATGLPWPSELVEEAGGVIRDKTTGINLTIVCEGQAEHYTGELSPKVVNGTKKTPSFEEFGPGAGALRGESGELTVSGKDYMAGFESLELITAKSIKEEEEKTKK